MGGYMQPARASNDKGAANLVGNLDIVSVSCNVLVRLSDFAKVRLCVRMLMAECFRKGVRNQECGAPSGPFGYWTLTHFLKLIKP